jgi:drug/metabolite transporter (DMT)-like permease
MKMLTVILVLTTNILFAASSVLFKRAVDASGAIDFSSFKALLTVAGRFLSSPLFMAGVTAAIAGSATYFLMLSRMNLSIAYPLLSLAYLFVALASMVFLKESIPLSVWIGILFICLGVALVSMKGLHTG